MTPWDKLSRTEKMKRGVQILLALICIGWNAAYFDIDTHPFRALLHVASFIIYTVLVVRVSRAVLGTELFSDLARDESDPIDKTRVAAMIRFQADIPDDDLYWGKTGINITWGKQPEAFPRLK